MQSEQQYLQSYDPSQFEHPSVTVDILIFTVWERRLRLLLIKRSHHPFLGKWAIPGGFLRMDESADEAAARRIREEAGVENVHLEQLYTFSAVDRDPRTRVISIAYLATVPFDKLQFRAGTEAGAGEAALFEIRGLAGENLTAPPEGGSANGAGGQPDRGAEALLHKDSGVSPYEGPGILLLAGPGGETITERDLAFDHARIIRTAVLRMRGKLDYTDLAFGFLNDPTSFTLTELRQIHEAILDRPLDIGNFRRTIKREYESTRLISEQGLEKGTVGRPAMLYSYDKL